MNIENLKKVLEMLEINFEMEMYDEKMDCITIYQYDEWGDCGHQDFYFNKNTGEIIFNYDEIVAIEEQIKTLQNRLEKLKKD